jgi:parallel beta-helix repeat protein
MYAQSTTTQGTQQSNKSTATGSAPSQPKVSSSPGPINASPAPKKPIKLILPLAIIFAIIVVAGLGFLYLKGYLNGTILSPSTTSVSVTTTIGSTSVGAISNCESVSSAGKYFLSGAIKTNITSGACINVTASNVSVICDSSSNITGSGPFVGIPPFTYAIEVNGQRNVTVSGCNIMNFSYGIFAMSSNRLNLQDNNLSTNYMADIYLNNSHNSTINNNHLSKSSSTQGALFLTNHSTSDLIINNTDQYNQYYGINVNSSNDTFQNNFINGTEYSMRCSAPDGFVISSKASLNVCYNNTGCGFLECHGLNVPANLSLIILPKVIRTCGKITSPGSYMLESNVNMQQYVNTSNIFALLVPCIQVAAKNVVINCKGFGITNSTIALSASNIQNLTVENCHINSASQTGISLSNVSISYFYNLTLIKDNLAIQSYNSSINTFSNVLSTGSSYGLYLDGSFSNSFFDFNGSKNTYGVYLKDQSFSNIFNKDVFENNSKLDVFATADSTNSSYDLMQSTTCGTTDAVWATCKNFVSASLAYVPLSTCDVISSPGNYLLGSSVYGAPGKCLQINGAENVALNCENHTISSSEFASGPGLLVTNSLNVSIFGCNFVGFTSTVNVTNSSDVSVHAVSTQNSKIGVIFNKVSASSLTNSTINGTANESIIFNHVSSSKMLFNNLTLGQSLNIGILLNNSQNNTVLNNTGSRNYVGLELLGSSFNNMIQNNTMQLSTRFDYMCAPADDALSVENGGINYGTTKDGCNWLAAITTANPLVQCAVAQQPNLFLLSQDAKYGVGTVCFSVYNATTINCAGHTVIATDGGTFAQFIDATGASTIENCFLKGFVNTIESSGSVLTVYNNTIFENASGTTAINITDSRFGATVQDNNVSVPFTAIALSNIGSGISGAEFLKNNIVYQAATAYALSNITSFIVSNNTASVHTYNGLVISNSNFDSFQNNNFLSATTGLECTGGAQGASNDTDLGGNSCSSASNCFWIRSSSGRCQ